MNKRYSILIIILIWVFIISFMIMYHNYKLETGTKVLLKTQPVDPWDLFRGNYVTLSYDISRLDFSSEIHKYKPGDTVYIILKQDGKYHRFLSVRKTIPDKLFIKGIVQSHYSNNLRVKYGIESYFIEEKTGRYYENNMDRTDIEIVLDDNGFALINKLIVNEQEEIDSIN
jgi:uncharacterized membrane-anchored protein